MEEKIMAALAELAGKLGTTVEYLWGVLLAQGRIAFVLWLFGIVVAIVSAFVFFRALRAGERFIQDKEYRDWSNVPGRIWVVLIFSGFASLTAIINASVEASNGLTGLLNPGFYALKTIFGAM